MKISSLKKVIYADLNAKQKENYNFQKVSSILADYGFVTIKLNDDWQGADFIAQHIDGELFLKIQLKGRLTFDRKYIGKEILICFCDGDDGDWYMYPHDDLLKLIEPQISETSSWKNKGSYSWPTISKNICLMLENYKI